MNPENIGVIEGFTEYPAENINRPMSHSIIRLTKVNLDMTGDYTCSVSTFLEDDAKSKRMTIYGNTTNLFLLKSIKKNVKNYNGLFIFSVPDNEMKIHANPYNNTHVNLTCISTGARPRPSLTIIVDNQQLEDHSIRVENYRGYPWIKKETIVPDFTNPVIIQCEISIPGTGYRRREKLVYLPNMHNRN